MSHTDRIQQHLADKIAAAVVKALKKAYPEKKRKKK